MFVARYLYNLVYVGVDAEDVSLFKSLHRLEQAKKEQKRVDRQTRWLKNPKYEEGVLSIRNRLRENIKKATTEFLFCVCAKYGSYEFRAPEFVKLLMKTIHFNTDARQECDDAKIPRAEFEEELPCYWRYI